MLLPSLTFCWASSDRPRLCHIRWLPTTADLGRAPESSEREALQLLLRADMAENDTPIDGVSNQNMPKRHRMKCTRNAGRADVPTT